MFERFTESARRALFFARYESSQLGSLSIETEHVLLGLVRDGTVLKALIPVPPQDIRRTLEGRITVKDKVSTAVEIPFSKEMMRVLQFATEEADRLVDAHIGSEHLVLGLLREGHSVAASTLVAHGVRLGDVRRDVETLRVPLPASPEAVTRLVVEQIKGLVGELARAPRGSQEADALVTRIGASLDALLNGYGIR